MLRRLLLCLAFAATASAQELDVWDVNDFVDPRILAGDDFLIFRVLGGGVANYVDIFRLTNVELGYVHLAGSYYRGRWQVNVKRTELDNTDVLVDENAVRVEGAYPKSKSALQFGFYHGKGDNVHRTQLTWTSIEYRQRERVNGQFRGFASRYDHEIGIEHDFSGRIWKLPLDGSLVYVGRFSHKLANIRDRQRVSYVHRFPRIPLGNWSLDFTGAAGILRNDGRWGNATLMPAAHLISPTFSPANVRLHLKYAPAFLQFPTRTPEGRGTKWEDVHQWTIFFDVVAFKKLFPHDHGHAAPPTDTSSTTPAPSSPEPPF